MTPNAIQKANPLQVMAQRFNIDEQSLMATLKATCFRVKDRQATNEEVYALCIVANEYGLNPFRKELYAFSQGGAIIPIVPVDGWARIITSNPGYDGCEFNETFSSDGKLFSTTCVMHVKGRSQPVTVTEYFAETYRNTAPWNQMPCRMNRHKAFMQAGRYAFGIGGLHDDDEATDIIVNATPMPLVRQPRRLSEPAPQPIAEPQPPADEQAQDMPPLDEPEGSPPWGPDSVPPEEPAKQERQPGDWPITEPQRKRLYAIYKKAGKSDEMVKMYLKSQYGYDSSKEIMKSAYESICSWAAA